MTWTRIGQMTAEARVVTNIDQQSTNGPTISSTQVHTGAFSYLLNSGSTLWGTAVASPQAINRVGYFLRHNGLTSGSTSGYLYMAANGVTSFESANIGIRINTNSSLLEVVRPVSGTTNSYEVLASATIPASLSAVNSWLHIGIYHYADQTSGVLNLYINGVLVLNYSGDTRLYGQGNGTPAFGTAPTHLWIMGQYTGTAGATVNASSYVDDLYFDNSADETTPAPPPAKTFDVMTVSGSGSNAGWTPSTGSNFQNVDDNSNNGDTDYNKALSTGLKDSFNFTNITVPADHVIVAMIPTVFVKRLDSGTDVEVRLIAYDGGTYKNGADQLPTLDYAIPLFERMTTQPDGTDWNETDANAMEFGYESRGTYS